MKGQRWAKKHIARVLDRELAAALKRCPDDLDLLALKGSRSDTLSDAEVLLYLEDWKKTGKVLHERCPHCPYASPTGCDCWCLEERQ